MSHMSVSSLSRSSVHPSKTHRSVSRRHHLSIDCKKASNASINQRKKQQQVQPQKPIPTVAGIPKSLVAPSPQSLIDNNHDDDDDDDAELTAAELAAAAADEATAKIFDAVVKIFCNHNEPNFSMPWQRERQYSSYSSGFMLASQGPAGERWVLTNAHSVDYHSQVKVKRRDDDKKFLAKVLAIGTECDVALLTVEDDEFWRDVEPLRFGPLPRLQDSVYVVGFPVGGETISVTSGVVSRVEVTSYSHGATELLGIQIDAAINSGNSGGPVFNEYGEVCGIAFQSYSGLDVENIGYVIPTPVINHFLDDYRKSGMFTGFPALGITWQRMESNALRSSLGMRPEQRGVLVRDVLPVSHAAGVLQQGDIIMRFDGVQLANDGTVPFRSGERIAFSYLTSQKFVGDMVEVFVLRDSKEVTVNVPLMKPAPLIPHHLTGADPSYFILGGLVFTVVTVPYLESEYGSDFESDAPVKLLDALFHRQKSFGDQEVVVIGQVLATEATLGYEGLSNVQVKGFNGEPVRNLRHLAEMVLNCNDDPYMRFDVEYKESVVLDTKEAKAATEEVLRMHSIPSIASRDLHDLLVVGSSNAVAA